MSLRKWIMRYFIQRSKLTSHTALLATEGRERYEGNERKRFYKIGAGVLLGSVLVGASVTDLIDRKKGGPKDKEHAVTKQKILLFEAGSLRPDLPTYSAEEVRKHDSMTSFWVTYKHGVYDVTAFLPAHPGGAQIHNAAGLSIEPFWNVYGMHHSQEVYRLLESYRIGNLHPDDIVEHADEELWAREPPRDGRLLVKTARPFNAETPPDHLIAHFDTPNELFYVRQHMPVPELEADTHTLKVEVVGARGTSRQYTLKELSQFKQRTVRAALMCAGNRRSEMVKEVQEKQVKGISWSGGAVGNAVWGGVYLRDVLEHCGLGAGADADAAGKHVILRGADIDATGVNFSTSIPLSMALNPNGEILLATHMNGVPLAPDHGYPLRAVVPGAPAVRSVKWLESITVSTEESPSHWHQKDYRSFNSSDTWETADFPSAPPVYSLPVTSAVCAPRDGDTVRVDHGYIEAKGYAYSGGGAKIVRVDVSGDGGATWRAARLLEDPAPPPRHYGWTLWSARVPAGGQPEMELWVKATDSNFNTQPERFEHIWNIRGILSNAYHRIKIKLKY